MTQEELKHKIRQVLKTGYFRDPDDLVDVSDGTYDLSIWSSSVANLMAGEPKRRHDRIWDELTQNLTPEEWGHISLSIGVSPEEIKAI